MAIADNRTGSLNLQWDYDALKSDFENPEMDMSPFFTEKEVIEFSVESGDAWQEEEEPVVPQNKPRHCTRPTAAHLIPAPASSRRRTSSHSGTLAARKFEAPSCRTSGLSTSFGYSKVSGSSV